ncbi:type II toxin-antitoxin system Phd/YefM family antitoxin [Streptosporangium sp. NPDC048047]|uniref:type II toxin-antitoxin system Phd/YefM family antitoxin n=1 Tax=Streptosporangium sp. NPDC048047 TaxID=3155748 RepID=UPI003430A6F2
MTNDALGIVEARNNLGVLVARAAHRREATRIRRSAGERAVLISEEDYEELLRLRREQEVAGVAAAIAAHGRGETDMAAYDSAADLYADLGLPAPGEHA